MRDPSGRVIFEQDFVVRHLNEPADDQHFLRSDLARRWVELGLLVPYEWLDNRTVRSPRFPFVTLPSEWTAAQFYTAAHLTIRLHVEAVIEGWDLKDASAWNIVFNGLNPVFVDLLSFERIQEKYWRAAGQFSRHFLLPLLLEKMGLMEASHSFRLWRDGVPCDSARRLLGLRRFLTRYWPLMIGNEGVNTRLKSSRITDFRMEDLSSVQVFRARLNSSLRWMLEGVCPLRCSSRRTIWGGYESNRNHYSEPALIFKRDIVKDWLGRIQPKWVLDVGSNAGEFSDLAVRIGARAICWDADAHALSILVSRHSGTREANHFFPILSSVDDLTGGRGWMGTEFPSMADHLHQRCDVVMMLAITHHLAIANGVRLRDIFSLAAYVSTRALLLELLSERDSRVIELCQRFNRDPSEFTIDNQISAAASAGFRIIEHVEPMGTYGRQYIWLERSPAV
jgi:hypothetical protein